LRLIQGALPPHTPPPLRARSLCSYDTAQFAKTRPPRGACRRLYLSAGHLNVSSLRRGCHFRSFLTICASYMTAGLAFCGIFVNARVSKGAYRRLDTLKPPLCALEGRFWWFGRV